MNSLFIKILLSVLSLCVVSLRGHADERAADVATHYYENPNPGKIADMLVALENDEIIQKEQAQAPLIAFLALVFRNNPDKVTGWVEATNEFADSSKAVVLKAVWYSKAAGTRELLRSLAEKESDGNKALVDHLLERDAPEIHELEITSPAVLDMQWGAFFASGDAKYIQRLISVLPYAENKGDDLGQRLIGEAARWSLTSNAVQHVRVLEICERGMRNDQENTARVLGEIVERAKSERSEGKGK